MIKPRLLIALILFVFAVTLPSFAQSNVDIGGYYFIENPPKAFADISEILLAGNYGASEEPPFYGLIRLKKKSAKDFALLKPTLASKKLMFKTRSVGGVYYEFSGRFTRLDDFPSTQPEGEILLKGKLTKYRGKHRIAVSNLSFSYSAGD